MASSAPAIGTLSVIIGGDASALDKMLKGAQGSITGFAAKVGQIAGGVGLVKAVEGITSALVDTIKKGLDTASSLSKITESSGAAVGEVSKLSYAMTIATGSNESLARSLQSLSTGIADVAAGKVTDASNAINTMGLNVRNTDGSLKSSTQLLSDVADKFEGYKNGASKAALAQALFGAGGEAMIPLLNKGSAGISELGDEAQKFGLVLDGPAKAAVQSINTNLAKLDATKQGLALTIAGKLAPAFAAITGAMLNLKTNSNLVEQASDVMAGAMKYVASIGLTVVTVFGRVTSSIGDLFAAARQLGKGDFTGAWNTLTTSADKSVEAAISLKDNIEGLYHGIQKDAPAAADAVTKVQAPLLAVADATKNALDLYLNTSAKRAAAMRAEALTIGQTADQQARIRVEEEAEAIRKSLNIKLTDDYRAKITAAGNAAAAAALQLQGANVTQESLTAWEQRNQKLGQYQTLLTNAAISQETFNRMSLKTQFPNFAAAAQSAVDFGMQVDQVVTSSLNGLASTLAQVWAGTKSAGEAFAAFGLQVMTQLAEMVIKAILFKVILTAIGFAGGGPVGTMQVGDQFFPSFDSGGFTGIGGRLEPAGIVHKGEDVFNQDDVARWGGLAAVERLRLGGPAALELFDIGGPVGARVSATSVPQIAPPSMSAATPVTVQMQGKLFTRDMLADLIDGLNGMTRNGYRLNLA
jgi:lambda family phage tail tape measure protein